MERNVILVDENDNEIGEATNEEAHEKRLLHRIIHVIVRNSKGEVLLQKRQGGRGAGLWDVSVGGHVDAGESYEQAAKREMREELGVNVPIKFAFKFENKPKFHYVACFTAKCEGPFQPNEESSELRFMNKTEIKEILTVNNFPSSAVISLNRILGD